MGYMTKKGIADKFAEILAHISTHNSEKQNIEQLNLNVTWNKCFKTM